MNAKYTYWYLEPSDKPPFKKRKRFTRGRYIETTEPTGCFGFRYAIFHNRASDVWIPTFDLTDETREAIAQMESQKVMAA
jgi:hypothetical protein